MAANSLRQVAEKLRTLVARAEAVAKVATTGYADAYAIGFIREELRRLSDELEAAK